MAAVAQQPLPAAADWASMGGPVSLNGLQVFSGVIGSGPFASAILPPAPAAAAEWGPLDDMVDPSDHQVSTGLIGGSAFSAGHPPAQPIPAPAEWVPLGGMVDISGHQGSTGFVGSSAVSEEEPVVAAPAVGGEAEVKAEEEEEEDLAELLLQFVEEDEEGEERRAEACTAVQLWPGTADVMLVLEDLGCAALRRLGREGRFDFVKSRFVR